VPLPEPPPIGPPPPTSSTSCTCGTPDINLIDLEFYGRSYSDWGGSIDHRKSKSAYIQVFLWLRAAITCKVEISQTAYPSVQEVMYHALSEATKEVINFWMPAKQLRFGSRQPTMTFCDNKGAITMGLHP